MPSCARRDIPADVKPQLSAEDPTAADVEFLEERLYEFNCAATGILDGRGLGFFVRDEAGQIVAGAAGHTWGDTCDVRQVWITETLRGTGLGRRLLETVEAEARRRGCHQIVLTTHSFQAPGFYAKLGYERVSELEDYPRGHAHLQFRKRLG